MPKHPTNRIHPTTQTKPRRPKRKLSDKPEFSPHPLSRQIEQTIELIEKSRKIVVLIGAGVSTSSGIPDFRSPDGLYAAFRTGAFQLPARVPSSTITNDPTTAAVPPSSSRPRRNAAVIGETSRRATTTDMGPMMLGEDEFDLVDPQELMSIDVFRAHPEVFYSVAWQLLPTDREPSVTHRWIKSLEDRGKLLRLYTQNVDQLEVAADIHAVTFCHGSFATASCLRCARSFPGSDFYLEIKERKVPMCPVCNVPRTGKFKGQRPFVKPDITFFGEAVDMKVEKDIQQDRLEADLLVVIGTSLLVPPVNRIPMELGDIPQILINHDTVKAMSPTVFIQGDCDEIVRMLDGSSAPSA